MAACRSCQASVFWRRNIATGKAIPIDRQPSAEGNVVLVGEDQCRFLKKGEDAQVTTYTSHFATCPEAARHRKPKAKA